MEFETRLRLAIYRHFAETGEAPTVPAIARTSGADEESVRRGFGELRAVRLLLLEPSGVTIRMASRPWGATFYSIIHGAGRVMSRTETPGSESAPDKPCIPPR